MNMSSSLTVGAKYSLKLKGAYLNNPHVKCESLMLLFLQGFMLGDS
uniref:Uncharacterized protein n=1 Tax=Rhizophora mucronata TaxID=61149 RepID=A0A2P2PYF5_RHIMU